MSRSKIIFLFAFVFVTTVPTGAIGQSLPAPPDLVQAAVAERNAREEARRACADGRTLRPRILAGTADPRVEATAAVDRGCFGLITTYSAIPRGVAYGAGIACRPNGRLFRHGGLMLLSFSGSDVLPATAEEAERRAREFATLEAFALAYNRAVLARTEFPLHDLCRVAADDYSPGVSEDLTRGQWGYRLLEQTDAPIDVYEAARRGTLESLRRQIEARPVEVHVPDLLGLTPLAWAVIYDRPEQVRLLLAAGAHPFGEPYVGRVQENSPAMIAREERNRGMALLMQPVLERLGLPMPEVDPRLDRDRSSPYFFALQPGWTPALATLLISAEGRVTDCLFQGPDGTEADCERARRSLFFLPAEDGAGRADRSKSILYIPVDRP